MTQANFGAGLNSQFINLNHATGRTCTSEHSMRNFNGRTCSKDGDALMPSLKHTIFQTIGSLIVWMQENEREKTVQQIREIEIKQPTH